MRGPKARDLNQHVSEQRFHYGRCLSCGTVSLIDVPADLGRFYPREYFRRPAGRELEADAALEAEKLALVRTYAAGGRLIEIGPGTGAFAYAAQRAGFDVTAVELDAGVCEHLRSALGVRAIQHADPAAALMQLPPARVIAMWHVLEHLSDPAAALDAAADGLEPGGVLALSKPNPNSLQFRLLRARWLHLDAPRHLALIPLAAVTQRLRRAGLRLVAVTTSDFFGRYCNRGGWERAIVRRRPARWGSRAIPLAAGVLEWALRPIEGTGLRGTTYTAVFVKDGG